MMDIDNDGIVGAKEYRYNCITRIAVESIQVVDDAFDKLLDVRFSQLIEFCFFSLLFCVAKSNLFVKFIDKGRRSTTRRFNIGKISGVVRSLLG